MKNTLGVMMASLALFLALESVARIAATITNDLDLLPTPDEPRWFVYSPTLSWERRAGYSGQAGWYERAFDEDGYVTVDSDDILDRSKKRIAFLGDSNTYGHTVTASATFSETIERLHPGVYGINLGVSGYSSYQGRVMLDKYLPVLEPDILVVSFNYNDRRYVLPHSAADSAEEFQRVYATRATDRLRLVKSSYLLRATRSVMRRIGVLPAAFWPSTPVNVETLPPRVDEDAYRSNLNWFAEQAKRLGIPVVFILLRDNPLRSEDLRLGIERMEDSKEEAIAYLRAAVSYRNEFSDLGRIYLSRLYRSYGDAERAEREAINRTPWWSLHGGAPVRLDSAYNDIMREVAMEHGAELVDAAAALHFSDYDDFCHFNENGHRKIAELLAERLSRIDPGLRARATQ